MRSLCIFVALSLSFSRNHWTNIFIFSLCNIDIVILYRYFNLQHNCNHLVREGWHTRPKSNLLNRYGIILESNQNRNYVIPREPLSLTPVQQKSFTIEGNVISCPKTGFVNSRIDARSRLCTNSIMEVVLEHSLLARLQKSWAPSELKFLTHPFPVEYRKLHPFNWKDRPNLD